MARFTHEVVKAGTAGLEITEVKARNVYSSLSGQYSKPKGVEDRLDKYEGEHLEADDKIRATALYENDGNKVKAVIEQTVDGTTRDITSKADWEKLNKEQQLQSNIQVAMMMLRAYEKPTDGQEGHIFFSGDKERTKCAAAVLEVVRQACPELLEGVKIFTTDSPKGYRNPKKLVQKIPPEVRAQIIAEAEKLREIEGKKAGDGATRDIRDLRKEVAELRKKTGVEAEVTAVKQKELEEEEKRRLSP